MTLATPDEYSYFWNIARVWHVRSFSKPDYHCIGAIAEFLANKVDLSLYNQSLRPKNEKI
jgi:hypothetical protein